MEETLTQFKIEGLYGQKTLDATIADDTLVLVGENGSGKTTFLRILFTSSQGAGLRWFRFDSPRS